MPLSNVQGFLFARNRVMMKLSPIKGIQSLIQINTKFAFKFFHYAANLFNSNNSLSSGSVDSTAKRT
jgi:hypothetical protein